MPTHVQIGHQHLYPKNKTKKKLCTASQTSIKSLLLMPRYGIISTWIPVTLPTRQCHVLLHCLKGDLLPPPLQGTLPFLLAGGWTPFPQLLRTTPLPFLYCQPPTPYICALATRADIRHQKQMLCKRKMQRNVLRFTFAWRTQIQPALCKTQRKCSLFPWLTRKQRVRSDITFCKVLKVYGVVLSSSTRCCSCTFSGEDVADHALHVRQLRQYVPGTVPNLCSSDVKLEARPQGLIHTGSNDATRKNGTRSHFDARIAWCVQCGHFCCCNGIFTSQFASLVALCPVWTRPKAVDALHHPVLDAVGFCPKHFFSGQATFQQKEKMNKFCTDVKGGKDGVWPLHG